MQAWKNIAHKSPVYTLQPFSLEMSREKKWGAEIAAE